MLHWSLIQLLTLLQQLIPLPISPTTLLHIALEERSHGLADERMEGLVRRTVGQVDETDLTVDGLVSFDDSPSLDADERSHSRRGEVYL